MTIGLAIVCRYSSSRLPGKILREIHGRAVLGHIVDRVRRGAPECPVAVCTSRDASDDVIEDYCRRNRVDCFRGSLDDVAGRFLACAEHYGWQFVGRINGDNLFTDPDTIRSMVAIAGTDAYDLVTNVPGRTFPYGMSVELVRTDFFRNVMNDVDQSNHREHVTSWLYENPTIGRRFVYRNENWPAASGRKLALDTEADLIRFTHLHDAMDRAPDTYRLCELVELLDRQTRPSPWKGRHGPLIIAEIGGNHEGNFEYARRLTQQAVETGADFVKFQLYRGEAFVSPVEGAQRRAHFKRFELEKEQHIELARMCEAGGVGYMASVWDLEMLSWVDDYMPIYKIGSGDLTAWPLVRTLASRGKPIILSTGLATLEDVLQTVAQIQHLDPRYRDPNKLCLLQCTSMYPIDESEANLRVMDTLRSRTGLAVGYSDHTEGGAALRCAAAMGAEVLEFHFTDDRAGKKFRDHKVSLTPSEVGHLQVHLDRLRAMRGSRIKTPQPSEIETGHVISFRRAVYLTRSMKRGEVVSKEDVTVMRPNHGLDARDMDYIVGKTLARDVRAFEAIGEDALAE